MLAKVFKFVEQLCEALAYGEIRIVLQAGKVTHVGFNQSWKPEELPEELNVQPARPAG